MTDIDIKIISVLISGTFPKEQVIEAIRSDYSSSYSLNVETGEINQFVAQSPSIFEKETCVYMTKLNFSIPSNFHFKKTQFDYILNPDGTMRWIYPSTTRHPLFLDFYSTSTLKAKLLARATRLGFALGFKNHFKSGSFFIYHARPLFINEFVAQGNDAYSLFTGTAGPNRKMLLTSREADGSQHFVKIALTRSSQSLLKREHDTLSKLNRQENYGLVIPRVHSYRAGKFLQLTGLKPKTANRPTTLSKKHLEVLATLKQNTHRVMRLEQSGFYRKLRDRLAKKYPANGLSQGEQLYKDLQVLFQSIDPQTTLSFCLAHGDFTPWNLLDMKNEMAMLDWELSMEAPVFYDLFHFIFQTRVLVHHERFDGVNQALQRLLSHPMMKEQASLSHPDVTLYLKLYLLDVASYYLEIYTKQKQLHTQGYWLLDTWSEATEKLSGNSAHIARHEFMASLFDRLNDFNYAVLKQFDRDPRQLSQFSDLDLLVEKQAIPRLVKTLEGMPTVSKAMVRKRSHVVNLTLSLKDDQMLFIDLIHRFVRKSVNYLPDAERLLDQTRMVNGIRHASYALDTRYCFLFYQLNRSDFPQRYIDDLNKLSLIQRSTLTQQMNERYHTGKNNLMELTRSNNQLRSNALQAIHQSPANRWHQKVLNGFRYLWDTLRDFASPGFIITFSGVDGSGKSTIIREVHQMLDKKYRQRVIVLRHRPGILPILSALRHGKTEAEARAASTLPRQGKNQSVPLSILRFLWYYTDYLFGQLVISLRYVSRGYVVLYDRYYYDFMNDPRRSNLNLPEGLTRALFRFVMKPKFNFFLRVPSEVVLKRKQELPAEEIDKLNKKYTSSFHQLAYRNSTVRYVVIENLHLNETLQTIELHLQSRLN